MQKPSGYDEAPVMGNYEKISPGGHVLEIKKVEECIASNGNAYVNVIFDTDITDSQPHYYMDLYKNDTRPDKKWCGNKFVFVNDYNDPTKTNSQFKGFTTSVEASNKGFIIPWGDGFCDSMQGKKVGGVFREEEYMKNDGTIGTAVRLAWFQSVNTEKEAKIPDIKHLKNETFAPPMDDVPW